MLARNICYNELSETEREEVVKATRKIHSAVNLFNGKNVFEAAVNNEPYSKWTALVRQRPDYSGLSSEEVSSDSVVSAASSLCPMR